MEICSLDKCTGCGACAYICPNQCIKMEEDSLGVIYPAIDKGLCVGCNKCKTVCPSLNDAGFNQPKVSYAAWSANVNERRSSASGGVGAEIYYYALDNNMVVAGAKTNHDFSVALAIAENKEDAKSFKNSKYVFSTLYSLYPELKKTLEAGKGAVVIALPCQIAAIKKVFKGYDNLYLADVVCHGTTSVSYLRQHIKALEKIANKKTTKMSFRDPSYKTSSYTFTLYDSGNNCFYAQRTKDGDCYQFGYHKAVSYRENCYNCRYAQQKRVSDITLCDYWGLGKKAPWEYEKEEVTCILVNTEKGKEIIDKLIAEKRILAYERPIEEETEANNQLRHPVKKSKMRMDFEKNIKRYKGDFEAAMAVVIRKNSVREKIYRIKSYVKRSVKQIIKRR